MRNWERDIFTRNSTTIIQPVLLERFTRHTIQLYGRWSVGLLRFSVRSVPEPVHETVRFRKLAGENTNLLYYSKELWIRYGRRHFTIVLSSKTVCKPTKMAVYNFPVVLRQNCFGSIRSARKYVHVCFNRHTGTRRKRRVIRLPCAAGVCVHTRLIHARTRNK